MSNPIHTFTRIFALANTDKCYWEGGDNSTDIFIEWQDLKTLILALWSGYGFQEYATQAAAVTAATAAGDKFLAITPGTSGNGMAGSLVFNISGTVFTLEDKSLAIAAINTTTTSLQSQIDAINAAISSLSGFLGVSQSFDPNDNTTWAINPGTSFMYSIGYDTGSPVPPTGDVTLVLPPPGSFVGGELVIFSGPMGGFHLYLDPTVNPASINGDTSVITDFGTADNTAIGLKLTFGGDATVWTVIRQTSVAAVLSLIAGTETGAERENVFVDPVGGGNVLISVDPAVEHIWALISPATILNGSNNVDLLQDRIEGAVKIDPSKLYLGKYFDVKTSFVVSAPIHDAFSIAIGTDATGQFVEAVIDSGGADSLNDQDACELYIRLICINVGSLTFSVLACVNNISKGVFYSQAPFLINLVNAVQYLQAYLVVYDAGSALADIQIVQLDGVATSPNGIPSTL